MSTVLKVWDATGETIADAEDADVLALAVGNHVERGIDSLVRLRLASGGSFYIRASTVAGWLVVTPEMRRRSLELEVESRDEEREHRMAVGLPWDEGE